MLQYFLLWYFANLSGSVLLLYQLFTQTDGVQISDVKWAKPQKYTYYGVKICIIIICILQHVHGMQNNKVLSYNKILVLETYTRMLLLFIYG